MLIVKNFAIGPHPFDTKLLRNWCSTHPWCVFPLLHSGFRVPEGRLPAEALREGWERSGNTLMCRALNLIGTYHALLLVFFAVPLSPIYAGEMPLGREKMLAVKQAVGSSNVHAERVKQKMERLFVGKTPNYSVDLGKLSTQIVCNIAQVDLEPDDISPFWDSQADSPKNWVSIKDFQDVCYGQLQRLYGQWQTTQRSLLLRYQEYDIFAKDKNSLVNLGQARGYIASLEAWQNSRWHVYAKIAHIYKLLCAYDTPARSIDPLFLTPDKFPDLRGSLVMPTPQERVRPVVRSPLRKSRSTGT